MGIKHSDLPPRVAQSALVRRPEPAFRRFLLGSAVAHGVALAVVLGVSAWKAGPQIDLAQKPIRATLVRRGQARDPKLLPRIEEPPPPPPAAPKPVPIPGAPPAPPAPKAPARPSVDDGARRSRLFDAFKKTSARPPEDLAGAEDGDPDGDSATAEGERYHALLTRTVLRYYDVSQTIPDEERIRLQTLVHVKVRPDGGVDLVKLAQSSGNDLFDSAVLAAVKKAAPFPPPPAHLRDSLRSEGVVLRFRP
jgi:TonB family protein